MISRNCLFIDSDMQEKIKSISLMFAGCGLGGNIALLATRTGFARFTLFDFDNVTISNLNRQVFNLDFLSKNKAKSLECIIKLINPSSDITAYSKEFKANHLRLVKNYDFIINTLDLNDIFYKLIDKTIDEDKTVFIPMNLGFGALLITINKKTGPLDDFLKNNKPKSELDFIVSLYKNGMIKMPEYIINKSSELIKKINKFNPQLAVASNLTSSLIVTNIIKIISDRNYIPPKYNHIDLTEFIK
ncbi:MAG: ThiF family adenylyltransferase [Patescibacteria group bacterium]|nr:ThiF family adenylyltransferase [Patescibacteria group bacterium]